MIIILLDLNRIYLVIEYSCYTNNYLFNTNSDTIMCYDFAGPKYNVPRYGV